MLAVDEFLAKASPCRYLINRGARLDLKLHDSGKNSLMRTIEKVMYDEVARRDMEIYNRQNKLDVAIAYIQEGIDLEMRDNR